MQSIMTNPTDSARFAGSEQGPENGALRVPGALCRHCAGIGALRIGALARCIGASHCGIGAVCVALVAGAWCTVHCALVLCASHWALCIAHCIGTLAPGARCVALPHRGWQGEPGEHHGEQYDEDREHAQHDESGERQCTLRLGACRAL